MTAADDAVEAMATRHAIQLYWDAALPEHKRRARDSLEAVMPDGRTVAQTLNDA